MQMFLQTCCLATHAVCSIQTIKSHIAQSNTFVMKSLVIVPHIWAVPLFPLIWTSPKSSLLTSWESLSIYLTEVANSALSEISVVSFANILKNLLL